jgi:allantoicase
VWLASLARELVGVEYSSVAGAFVYRDADRRPNGMTKLTHLVDLAAQRLGGAVLAANDEFFAPKENLLKPERAVFLPDKYTDLGKWMDGWETRRRRTPGHDWCIVRLGLPGVPRSIVVDTAFFRGNYPSHCSLDASGALDAPAIDGLTWDPLLPQSELRGDAENVFATDAPYRVTLLRLNIFPDGGVARLRVLGEALPDWRQVLADPGAINLADVALGAHIVDASDRFFGEPANMLMPYRAANMGDGWETKRRRGPGHDWVLIRLATEGTISRIELDTAHFKGNYPESCSIEAAVVEELAGTVSADLTSTVIGDWKAVVPRTPLQPDHLHVFEPAVAGMPATHVRLNIFPDGGVSRLRILGVPTALGRQRAVLRFLNSLGDHQVGVVLADFCAAPTWIEKVAAARPFASAAALIAAADRASDALDRSEWLEAFRHHPRIGGHVAEREQSDLARRASANEQALVGRAPSAELDELARLNRAYEDRFGHVFIVSAAGRGTDEILGLLRDRLKNDPAAEIAVAAGEQRRITRLRLEKLLG